MSLKEESVEESHMYYEKVASFDKPFPQENFDAPSFYHQTHESNDF